MTVTGLTFPALVDRLVAEELPSWLVYDGRFDPWRQHNEAAYPTRVSSEATCNDAWHLNAADGAWVVSFGGARVRERQRYPSEASACEAMYHHVLGAGERQVRAAAMTDLPAIVQDFIAGIGARPGRHRLGETFVARDGSMAWRMVATASGHRLDHPSIAPAAVGRTVLGGLDLEDACRLLVNLLAERRARIPGEVTWGLAHSLSPAERVRRLTDYPVERILAAYQGQRPSEVLDRIGEPAALHLLDDALLAHARGHGWTLLATDGPHGVRLTQSGDVDYLLAGAGGEYVISFRAERTNELREVARTGDLGAARARLRELLG